MAVLLEGSAGTPEETYESGERITEVRPGSLRCVSCGYAISLSSVDSLPVCPSCQGTSFKRASLFEQPTLDTPAVEVEGAPEWLTEMRAELDEAGHYIAFEDDEGDPAAVRLEPGWTRIGRSGAADIRFDDPTVSRRHALVVLTDSGQLRALDDRSLNGLFVNGEQVDWAPLGDGDELAIGRYRLHVLEA
ncbi:MAG TPA: FHA domain-containing protein [Solirubrobacterales bacterium]|nr:FHA domain-containing protein [Solirubrobacterales bacterium]